MWAGLIGLGVIVVAGLMHPKKEPVAEWIVIAVLSLILVFWLWRMIRTSRAVRLNTKIKLKEKLREIQPESEATCSLCGGTLMVGEQFPCSRCGAQRAAVTV
jgi:transposase